MGPVKRKKNGYDQRDLKRTGRRIQVAIWLEGKDLGDGCPFMWERDLREILDGNPKPPSDELFDVVLSFFLHPAIAILVRSGNSKYRGLGLKLTPAACRHTKRFCERMKAQIGKVG